MNRPEEDSRTGVDHTESSIEWPAAVKAAVLADLAEQPWRLYPHPQPEPARAELAELLNIDPGRIRFTSGADAAVDDLVRIAARTRSLWLPTPAYPGYLRAAARHRAAVHHYPAELTAQQVLPRTGTVLAHVIMTWPGNPIGATSPPAPPPSDTVAWTIDATYVSVFSAEFAALVSGGTDTYDVIFSCSKVEGLAGVRLGGTILATPSNDTPADAPGFPLNALQLATANVLLSPRWRTQIFARHEQIRKQHAALTAVLEQLQWAPTHSPATSFITVQDPIHNLNSADMDTYTSLHAKRFPTDGLLRITTCQHNLDALAELSLLTHTPDPG